MITSILISRAVDRQVEVLLRAGKKGERAVQNYRTVYEHLRRHCCRIAEIYAKRTKKGELRVKNCIKYHLGHGYRLVTIRIEDRLYLPFLGTHDEVDQWLESRRREGFEPVDSGYRQERLTKEQEESRPVARDGRGESSEDDSYERQLAERIDEALLKHIFTGLYQRQSDGAVVTRPNH